MDTDRITLSEGLTLLTRHLPTEQAKARLRSAFIQKAFSQAPLYAFPYDDAVIDWETDLVKISRKREPFRPTFLRHEFEAHFLGSTAGMADDEISEAGRKARFEQWERYGTERLKADLQTDPYRRVGAKAVQDLAWEFVRTKEVKDARKSEEKALIEQALRLGIPLDDVLTTDGEQIAWAALQDFKASIGGVLVEFHKGDRISDWHQIEELNTGRCPVVSLKSELWQRITAAQTIRPVAKPAELLTLKPNFHGIGIDLNELVRRLRKRFGKKKP